MRRQYYYLFTYLGARILFVVAVLTVLASVLTWMEGIKSLYAGEQMEALHFVLLKLPAFLAISLVPGTLLGVVLGLHQLGKRHELIAFFAQGVSPFQLVGVPVVALGVIFGILYALLLHVAVPATRHESDALASKLGISDPVTQLFSVQRHWVKTDDAFIYVDRVMGEKKLSGVVWIDKKEGAAPTLIAMGEEAEFRASATRPNTVVLVMNEAKIFEQDAQPFLQASCQKTLDAIREGSIVEVNPNACPMAPLESEKASLIEPQIFEREIPKSLGALLQLTGHPEGFFTDELNYLLGHASQYGYSLRAYSAALKARYIWPALLLFLVLFASLWGVRSKPHTGIYFPFLVMLVSYVAGMGLVHYFTQV